MKDLTCLHTITERRRLLARAISGFRRPAGLAVIATFAGLLFAASPALAQPSLGSAQDFDVLGGTAVTCTDSTIDGDVGVDLGGSITQTNCPVLGTVHPGDAVAQNAYDDFLTAYTNVAAVPCDFNLTSSLPLAGQSLAPGVYCFDAGVTETDSVLTLVGSSTDTWIFKVGILGTGALTGTRFSVIMPGGEPCNNNVFWWTAEAATLTDSPFIGSILAGTSITVTNGSLDGQALATLAVTLTGTSVCGPLPAQPSTIKVTGGGQIRVPKPDSSVATDTGTGQATFGFNAQSNISGVVKGRLNYLNKVTRLHVNGPVDDIVVIATNPDGSPKTVRFSGTCRAKSPACAFSVTVEDNGKGGKTDEFGITVTGAISEARSQRVLKSGNIEAH
jgi:hypothetical protein